MGPLGFPRPGTKAAHEERLRQRASSATPTHPQQRYQVTSLQFVQFGVPLGLHHPQAAGVYPRGVYRFAFSRIV